MFKALLNFHWKIVRTPLLLLAVATFAVPLVSVQRWGWDAGIAADGRNMIATMSSFAVLYPLLAATLGLLMAVTAWSKDHRGNHVYALTLPVERWRYVLLRYRAGAALMALPIGTLAVGAVLAGTVTVIPAGLSIYPLALTLRFALAAGVAFSVFFAISAGTTRTAGYILAGVFGLIVTQLMFEAAGIEFAGAAWLIDRALQWPGPFDVFGGRWMLIDV